MIMPVNEMHELFLHFYDKQSNFAAPEVTAEEVDFYLNNAQQVFIKILVEKGLEKSQEWMDYTKNITSFYSATSTVGTDRPNTYMVDLPSNYRLALLEEATITIPAGQRNCANETSARVTVVPITRDEYSRAVKNPFRKPWREEVFRLTRDGAASSGNLGQFELVTFTGSTITTYYLDYLREPSKIQYGSLYSTPVADVSCEFEPKAATRIIEIAVNFALQTMGDPRIATEQYDKLIKTI